MVVDFQHHYVPYELASSRGVTSRRRTEVKLGALPNVTLHEKLYDLDLQIADMDEEGIDVAVLSCLLGWDASPQECRLVNESMARAQQTYTGRFVGLAHIPAHQPEAAVAELRHAVEDLDLRGVSLTSQVKGQPLDARGLFEVYEAVADRDLPIFVHPAMTPRGYAVAEDHDLGRIIGREFDLCLASIRLIAGGVLETFPGLKFVMGHFGGGIAALKERIAKRVHRFDTPLNRPFQDYFNMLYFDMAGFEGGEAALETALRGIAPDRLVFATDYPQDFTGVSTASRDRPRISSYIAAIRERVDADQAEAMLGRTAAAMLKLPAQSAANP